MIKNYKALIVSAALFLLFAAATLFTKNNTMLGILFWAVFGFLLLILNGKSILQTVTIQDVGRKEKVVIAAFAILVILLCTLPMDLSPTWNGRNPMWRDQYERLADSMIEGHLYIDYDDVDPKLLTMENPYSWQDRIDQEVIYHWDHAFYNGHYYMYFGVVPVLLLFIPFKLVTGRSLVTFHATQIFTVLCIIAFFLLLYFIAKKYFPGMPVGTYIAASSAVSVITLGYFTQAPALYCTAISGGVCFMLWSLLLYFYAVFFAKKEKAQVLCAFLAALAGALAFGCRPPAALANIVAIPLAIAYAKNYKGKHIVRNFIIIAIPYVVVAALLMAYNYVRFDSPFEFGQAYQLTSMDQTRFSGFFERINFWNMTYGLLENFFGIGELTKEFPHFAGHGGFFMTYPLMWLGAIYLCHDSVRRSLKEKQASLFAFSLLLHPIIVTVIDLQWAGLCERYRLDAYFALGILVFILIGCRYSTSENPKRVATIVNLFSVVSVYVGFLLFMMPLDGNFAEIYPEKVEVIKNIIFFR